MCPVIPEGCVSSVTVKLTSRKSESSISKNIKFGVSKHHFADQRELGTLDFDWCTYIAEENSSEEYHDLDENDEDEDEEEGDEFTCYVDRKNCIIKFL